MCQLIIINLIFPDILLNYTGFTDISNIFNSDIMNNLPESFVNST